jgi:hypothetical protein
VCVCVCVWVVVTRIVFCIYMCCLFMCSAGKTGLMSRLFGSVDTEEVRELKVNLIEQKIQEGKISVCSAQKDLKYVEILASFLFLRNESRLRRSACSLWVHLSLQTAVKLQCCVHRIDIFLDSTMHIFISCVQIFIRTSVICPEYMSFV